MPRYTGFIRYPNRPDLRLSRYLLGQWRSRSPILRPQGNVSERCQPHFSPEYRTSRSCYGTGLESGIRSSRLRSFARRWRSSCFRHPQFHPLFFLQAIKCRPRREHQHPIRYVGRIRSATRSTYPCLCLWSTCTCFSRSGEICRGTHHLRCAE
jgi:hypothetical protein